MKRNTSKIEMRPISTIVRKHAKAAQQIGKFGMSEGYELCKTCFDDMILIRWHSARHGSSFNAPFREESIAKGSEVLNQAQKDLEQNGYTVIRTKDGMELEVRKAQ